MLWVDNTLVGGNLSVAGNTVTFSAVSISGLTVQIEYHLFSTSATLRNYTSFTNPTGGDITVTVDFANNFGSDGNTQIIASSSGDLAFGTDDRWVVTDDFSTTAGDPANTTVFYGPGSPAVTSGSVSQTVFSCAGTQGLLATYSMTVPAGGTRALMLFHQMNNTSTNGVSAATLFDVTPVPGDDLVTGLTAAQVGQVVNWGDVTPPEVTAALVPVKDDDDDEGRFRVEYGCSDACDTNPSITLAELNGIAVANGQIVELELEDDDEGQEVEWDDGILQIEASSFELVVECVDASGNEATATAVPQFADDDDEDDDDD